MTKGRFELIVPLLGKIFPRRKEEIGSGVFRFIVVFVRFVRRVVCCVVSLVVFF